MDANPSTLPDLLTEAARLMPERFERVLNGNAQHFYVLSYGNQQVRERQHVYVYTQFHDSFGEYGQRDVEYACRKECVARDWHAAYIPTIDGQRLAVTI